MSYDLYPKKYVTVQGNTWDTISLVLYGSPYKVKELVECNTQYSNILIFESGIELNIPILEDEKADSLAPWKRGA